MNQCNQCGAQNADNSKYCSECGFELPKKYEGNQEIPSMETKRGNKSKKKVVTIVVSVIAVILLGFGVQQLIGFGMKEARQFISHTPNTIFDKTLTVAASEINKNCPIMVDSLTRLDNTITYSNTFQYNYTLVSMQQGDLDTTHLKKIMKPKMINIVQTSPQMKQMRDHKVTMKYSYKDKNGVYLFQISITPEEYE